MTRPGLRVSRPAAAVLMAAVLTALGAGVAVAYWSVSGSGTGSAQSASLQTVTVAAFTGADSPAATLIPGGTADVIMRVTNPNASAVQIYSVAANGQITADGGHPACTTTGVSFVPPAAPVGVSVAANSTQLVHLPGAASMSTAAMSACQGATFHVPVTLTVRQ